MPEATIILLATALKTAMVAVTWAMPISASVRMLPKYETPDLDRVVVCIVPSAQAWELLARGSATVDDPTIDVGFLRKVKSIEEDVPPLMSLVEDVVDWLKTNRRIVTPDSGPTASIVRIEQPTPYDPGKLQSDSLFMSVLKVHLRRTS